MQIAPSPARLEALRHTAQAFEAQALSALLAPMFATVDATGGAFGGGQAEAQFRSLLTDQYAAGVARAGGIGLARAVYDELLRAQAR
jgi:Rod binding domain-containing protein